MKRLKPFRPYIEQDSYVVGEKAFLYVIHSSETVSDYILKLGAVFKEKQPQGLMNIGFALTESKNREEIT